MHAARVRATHKNFKNCEEMEMSAYHRSRPEVRYKVVLLGDYGVGKTSLFRRLRGDTFEGSTSSTVATGVEKCTRTFRMANGKSVMLDIWDTAGVERFRSVTRNYYIHANAVVFVYDITSYATLHALSLWIEDAKKYAPNAVPILIGNKYDADDPDVAPELSSVFAENNNIKIHFRVSAKKNEGIWETFQAIAQHIDWTCSTSGDFSQTVGQWQQISLTDTYVPHDHRCAGACSRS